MLIEDLQLLLNRRMRTRMYGGVGAAVSNGGGYPISPFNHASILTQRPKIDLRPIHPLIRPRLLPI